MSTGAPANPLPAHAAGWVARAVGRDLPPEPRSDCARCPMAHPPEGAPPPRFFAGVSCCGTWPTLPNFVVGRVLRDEALPEAGRSSVRARITAGVGVTPAGLGVPPAVAALAVEQRRVGSFGTSDAVICPHLRDGRCSIWAHREAVCATWFCRVSAGVAGQARWLAARALLQELEGVTAREAARRLGAVPGPPARWGSWGGRFEDYFRAAAEIADALTWEDLRGLGGFALTTRIRELKAALREEEPPSGAVVAGPATVTELPDGRTFVRTWSPYDALILDPAQRARWEAGAYALPADLRDDPDARDFLAHRLWVPAAG